MSYHLALEKAGAEILASKSFGSYQGTEWFLVKYKNETFWVEIPYGSCSGCDSFQATFGYDHHEHPDNDYFNPFWEGKFPEDCDECQKLLERLINFGESDLNHRLSQSEAEKEAARHIEWDYEANAMLTFIQETGKIFNVK